jgi:pimeloyl-ACP methyl ester carboxylesterase
MPLFSIAKFLTSLLSLLILAAAAYLLWSWYAGQWVADDAARLLRLREPWRLWTGAALAAWSFLGRPVIVRLLARPDERPTSAVRGEGRMVASASGASLYVERAGLPAGPPIILTHGWGMDSTFWNYAKTDLGDRFQLIVWDLPGLGRSKLAPHGEVSLSGFAADLETLVAELGGRKPVLVGHSIGGMTIQTLIRDRPEVMQRLAGLVLLDTTYTDPLRTMIAGGLMTALKPVIAGAMRLTVWLHPLVTLSKWQSYLSGSAHLAHRLGFGRHVTRSQLEHVTLLSTRNPAAVEAKGNLAMFGWDATGALGRLAIPALVIAGDRDIVTRLEANRRIAEESPRARLEVVEGANHLGPMERADVYDRLIADFVLAVQPSATRDLRPDLPSDGRTDGGAAPRPRLDEGPGPIL